MGNLPNFSLINLTTCMVLSLYSYVGHFEINNLKTHVGKLESTKYNPGFFIHTLGDDLYISVRGSLYDGDFQTLEDCEDVKTKYGIFHSGYFKAAVNTYSRSIGYIKKDYRRIFITGHSYGASVSQLLTVIVKTEFPDKEVYGIGFGPVPCMDTKTARKYKSSIVSIINKKDIVPSFSVRNVRAYFNAKYQQKELTKSEAIKDIIGLFDGLYTTDFTRSIKNSLLHSLRFYVTKAVSNNSKKHYIEYPAGTVYNIGVEGKTKISECVIDPAVDYNILSSDYYGVDSHIATPYLESLNNIVVDE